MGKKGKTIQSVKAIHNPSLIKKTHIRTEKKEKPDPSQLRKSYLHITPSLIACREKRLQILSQVTS